MKLQDLVIEILRNNIPISGVKLGPYGLSYEVEGFSKSGTATIYETEDGVKCETRYNTVNDITCFGDLVDVAFTWNANYAGGLYNYGWDSNWIPLFEKRGLVKVTKKDITNIEIA